MGKNNKARRAAKAKSRTRTRARAGAGGPSSSTDHGFGYGSGYGSPWRDPGQEPLYDQVTVAAFTWRLAAERRGTSAVHEFTRHLHRLPAGVVHRGAESLLLEHLDVLWASGWQPVELRRQGVLGCSIAAGARLVALAIAADHANRRAETLDSRWLAQVESLDLPVVNGRGGWLERWGREEGLERDGLIDVVLDALENVLHLTALEPLLPPPGSSRTSRRLQQPRGGQADPLLERIRNLLAKAESTSFEAEATALTAKAQELMTRHAVDAALIESRPDVRPDPVEIRLPVDAPYADAKSLLLQTIAETGRCRAVYLPHVSMSTVIGYPDDVAGVELLFTSLLVQAQHALREAAEHAAPGTRTRSQSYRSAFLLAFTQRIGQRLREINEAVLATAESEHGTAFLPVLSSMADHLDQYMSERFGDVHNSRVRGGYDAAGWSGGRMAADRARLSFGEISEEAV